MRGVNDGDFGEENRKPSLPQLLRKGTSSKRLGFCFTTPDLEIFDGIREKENPCSVSQLGMKSTPVFILRFSLHRGTGIPSVSAERRGKNYSFASPEIKT